MPPTKSPLPGVFLWLEGAALAAFALTQGQGWLLPVACIAWLLAALLSRGLWPALLAAGAAGGWWIAQGRFFVSSSALQPSYAVAAILLGIAFAFAGILTTLRSGKTGPSLGERLSRLAVILHFIVAGLFLADHRVLGGVPLILGWGSSVFAAILILDTLLVIVSRLYTPRDQWPVIRQPGAFFFFRWLGRDWRACLPAPLETEDAYLLRLPEMWMWPAVRRSLPALLGVIALLVWLGTCFHEVGAGQSGVRERFGALERDALSPGMHLSLPAPFGSVRTVESGKVQQIVLGFRSDTGRPILWERPHYVEEELSLVGGGDDFLSISVPILYQISNPRDYLLSATASEDLLRNLAKRSLLKLTLHRSAAEIMTTARESLRTSLHRELQAELDQRSSGLTVCDVYFRDIHPPVAVAPAFQEVVSAIEEKEALIHEGEEYQLDRLPGAKGDSKQIVVNAEAAANDRLLKANGEAARFSSLSKARAAAPAMYDFREGFKTFDLTLAGTKKVVFDEKMRGQIPAHLDLRRVLNPKLIDTAAPTAEPLIPDPMRAPERFNLNVEGYHETR